MYIIFIAFHLSVNNHILGRGAEGYFYEFSHRPSVSRKPYYITTDHTEDSLYTWGASLVEGSFGYHINYTNEEKDLDQMMVHYLANFVKTG